MFLSVLYHVWQKQKIEQKIIENKLQLCTWKKEKSFYQVNSLVLVINESMSLLVLII